MHAAFIKAVAGSFALLQVLFLANLSYLYATQFNSSGRVHNLKILYVDYDGGVVGQSLTKAYQSLKGKDFPTLVNHAAKEFPMTEDVKGAVCSGDFWAAIYTSSNASANLAAKFVNGTTFSKTALTYVWNGARYPAFSQSDIYSNIMVLIEASRSAYYASSASGVLASANLSNPVVLETFTDPLRASEINIKTTVQGTRVLYNTVSMVMPIIQQFFFMMALNGISAEYRMFSKFGSMANGLIRMVTSIAFTFVGALCTTGYIWGFKESWAVKSNQFVLAWMVIWLFMHINFMVFDVLTAFVPMQFMPFCVLTWAIMNVASSISPFELNPAFFRWGYALPAHEVYQVLVQIWSDGCQDQSYRALPILFAWWIVGLSAVIYATKRRCQMALEAEREQKSTDAMESDLRPSTSTEDILTGERRHTVESIRLERVAYGPSYPTPYVHGQE